MGQTKKQSVGVEFEKEFNYLKFKGKYYEFTSVDGKPTIVRVDEKEIKKQINLAKILSKKLKENLDTEAVLMERLMQMDIKELEKLHKMLFNSKIKYKPKTRRGHCVDMKIGRFILPIVD